MISLIPEIEVSFETLESILKDSAIDYERSDNDNIYITTFAFNFWISIDTNRNFIRFYSYWPIAENSSVEKILELVNTYNESLILVQFSLAEDCQRIDGQYIMTYRDGLIRTQLLRMTRLFSEVFHRAVEHEDPDGLLYGEKIDTKIAQSGEESGSLH